MSLSKIINKQFPDFPADLIDAVPLGSVEGYHKNENSNNQSWEIVVVGPDLLTFKNGSTGTYAKPAFEGPGAPIIGSSTPYAWRQLFVPGGWYQIATSNGRFVWFLTGDGDYAPIVLRPTPFREDAAQWAFEPTRRVE